jgi:hypothetical protein
MGTGRWQRRVIAAAAFVGALAAANVRASTIIDLSSGGSGTANGAIYESTDFGATGTGVINSFLGVQVDPSGMEQGYNHSLGFSEPWDTKPGGHTHDIQYQDLVVRNVLGVDYFEFLLDINERANEDEYFLSLDNVQIFTRSSPITSADESLDDLGTLRFNNDTGPDGDVTVKLNYSLNSGSGSGDMFLLVPVSLFSGTLPEDYVYFYTRLGEIWAADAGFEEWGLRASNTSTGGGGELPPQNTPVPEPGSMVLLGTGLMFAAKRLNRR